MRTIARLFLCVVIPLLLPVAAFSQDTAADLIARYQATDLTANPIDQVRFYQNPWQYQGQQVYFSGIYKQNISATQAIIMVQRRNPLVAETQQDLATWPFTILGCVGEVLGVTTIRQGLLMREVPHLQILECAPRSPRPQRKAAHADADVQAYLAFVEELIGAQWRATAPMTSASPVVTFRVEQNGTIANVAIKETSGDPGQDNTARQVVDSVTLPPFRPGMPTHLDIRYRFNTNPG